MSFNRVALTAQQISDEARIQRLRNTAERARNERQRLAQQGRIPDEDLLQEAMSGSVDPRILRRLIQQRVNRRTGEPIYVLHHPQVQHFISETTGGTTLRPREDYINYLQTRLGRFCSAAYTYAPPVQAWQTNTIAGGSLQTQVHALYRRGEGHKGAIIKIDNPDGDVHFLYNPNDYHDIEEGRLIYPDDCFFYSDNTPERPERPLMMKTRKLNTSNEYSGGFCALIANAIANIWDKLEDNAEGTVWDKLRLFHGYLCNPATTWSQLLYTQALINHNNISDMMADIRDNSIMQYQRISHHYKHHPSEHLQQQGLYTTISLLFDGTTHFHGRSVTKKHPARLI